jgi:hypothetical protein
VAKHDELPVPKVPPAQPPQKVVSMMILWLKNFSPKLLEHGPSKCADGVPNKDESGVAPFKSDTGTDEDGKNHILIDEDVHSMT